LIPEILVDLVVQLLLALEGKRTFCHKRETLITPDSQQDLCEAFLKHPCFFVVVHSNHLLRHLTNSFISTASEPKLD
jgi:hypothetical protein